MTKYTKLTYGGVLGALIFLGTYILKVPIVNGYIHLGDGIILLSAIILGPYAAVPAAIGSALADLASGYAMYAPFTFVIKALMAVIPALLITKYKVFSVKHLVVPFILAEAVMVAGYFLADSIFWGVSGAVLSVPMNVIQGISGVIIGIIGTGIILRSNLKVDR